ncbi:S-adenosylmethionine:tRNAribosyltransferase-isomerase [Striga asiatica]|uniref:S-adenosylmethionine:tRNAribosyltransferase-isomerase n=1 Tax=Striga asiatica TaxID=4170 RepID=A0A5A7QW64_STRAF|nr:S-adenosylmethionine:tRNAribosyltransferase-isomerase [Striga asiatica]
MAARDSVKAAKKLDDFSKLAAVHIRMEPMIQCLGRVLSVRVEGDDDPASDGQHQSDPHPITGGVNLSPGDQAGDLDKTVRSDHNVARSEEEEGIRNSVAFNQELQQVGDLDSTQLENPLNPVTVPQDKEESPNRNVQSDVPIVNEGPLLTDVSLVEVAIKPASVEDKNCHRKKKPFFLENQDLINKLLQKACRLISLGFLTLRLVKKVLLREVVSLYRRLRC